MSFVTKGIGLAKKVKHRFEDRIKENTPVYISPVRRIEQVATNQRVCAMTFDDGPCRLPCSPDDFGGKPFTLVLAETLEQFGAAGTFDVIGDTSKNYPDKAGKHGSASWGGVAYDHYPDFQKDSDGGVAHCPEIIDRLLSGGHEITSHTWSHILFGKKALVYGSRKHLEGLDPVVEDLKTMDRVMKEKWGYSIALSRPPHYVDGIKGGFSSYDAYGLMGYQYMAASFDGAGWLPLSTYEAEVEATWKPIEKMLHEDPDFFRGQIIFQKDGYNMARRSPIAHGLKKQLELLSEKGYKVVTVSQLLVLSPFRDIMPDTPEGKGASYLLEQGWCPAFRDNTLRIQLPLKRGELAMMAFGWEGVKERISLIRSESSPFSDMKPRHPYSGACALAAASGALAAKDGCFESERNVSREEIASVFTEKGLPCPELPSGPITHGMLFSALSDRKERA